ACGAGRLAYEPRGVRRRHIPMSIRPGVFGRLEYLTPPLSGSPELLALAAQRLEHAFGGQS
ncbi:MAG: hypothetical protein ACRDRB_24835, partial [Pseudonocardiaceae bacterium]